jgi:predicted peptidase
VVLPVLVAGCHGAAHKASEKPVVERHPTGFVKKALELDGQTYRYAVYVPQGYTPQRRSPAILFLHGIGECGDDGTAQMPQCRVGRKWEGTMATLALATLEATQSQYTIDPDRIVLTGLSLGGFGTWRLGAQQPERFAALVPVCGGGDPSRAQALARLPIWCFHGEADSVIPVERSREMVQAVRAAAGDVRYTEFPGVGHNAWDPAYGDPQLTEWMLAQHR